MSQYPPDSQGPGNPPPYGSFGTLGYQGYVGPSRPASITVLAVLAIIFGGLGTLCMGLGTLANLLQLAGTNLFAGLAGQMKISPAIKGFGLFAALLELGLSITLLMIGISALSLKPWARRSATSWWAMVGIAWAVVRFIAQVAWIGPETLEAVKHMQQSTPNVSAQQMQTFMSAGMVGGALFYLLLELLLPVLFLLLWRKPDVVAAFEGIVQPGTPGAANPYGTSP